MTRGIHPRLSDGIDQATIDSDTCTLARYLIFTLRAKCVPSQGHQLLCSPPLLITEATLLLGRLMISEVPESR